MCIALSGDEKNGALTECSPDGVGRKEPVRVRLQAGVVESSFPIRENEYSIISLRPVAQKSVLTISVGQSVVRWFMTKTLDHPQRALAAPVLHGEVEWRHNSLLHYLPLWTILDPRRVDSTKLFFSGDFRSSVERRLLCRRFHKDPLATRDGIGSS